MAAKKRSAASEDSEGASKRPKIEPVRRSQRNKGIEKVDATETAGASSKASSRQNTAPKSKQKVVAKTRDLKHSESADDHSHDEPKSTPNGTHSAKKNAKAPPTIERPAYWLMKAEPESRIEKGKDVKFSIDDLAATDKEPWDGVRNVVAKNNMKAMKKGEKAFFYHSNCKIPGIAGIMTIEDESSVDESAFDSGHPYYDEKSDRENPKWYLVHVRFLKKLDNLISLKELQKHNQSGSALEDMQVLRMSRLSVSRVSESEWNFICKGLAKIDPESLKSIA